MSVHISRVQISNFRNFCQLDVCLSDKAVIVGENRSGKTNFIHALRLILDPSLSDNARKLREEDFWDGLDSPMENGAEISISIDLRGFEDNQSLLAILQNFLVEGEPAATARITYKYAPMASFDSPGGARPDARYEFQIYGGDDPANGFTYRDRNWIQLRVLPALRDSETDLESWRRSPLRPLIERLNVTRQDLQSAADKIDSATDEIIELSEIHSLSQDIERRLEKMVGDLHSISPSLGIASTDSLRLLRSLRLLVDGKRRRPIGDTSLGVCNVIYLTLLVLELEREEAAGERAATILAIEEPEAHLHPHLQRLVYRDFLRRESPVLLTTHSPHIVSVSPIRSLVLLRDSGAEGGSVATSTAKADFTPQQGQDLERYLDATRGEILFARGVILVEGDAELYIVPAFAKALGTPLDQRGISVCSVQGTDFAPYAMLLGKGALDVPHVVITDGDPFQKEGNICYRGPERAIKLIESERPNDVPPLNGLLQKQQWGELYKKFGGYGIYLGVHTLEIDLANCGINEEMVAALKDLGAGKTRLSKFRTALSGGDMPGNDSEYVLKTIDAYGKGRFAQRLAPKLKGSSIPEYIKGAIRYIVSLLEGNN